MWIYLTQKFFSCENLSIWSVRTAPSFAIINSPCLRKERKLRSCIEVSMIPSAAGLYGGSRVGCSTFPLHHKQPLIWETDKQNAGTGHQYNEQNSTEHFSGETKGGGRWLATLLPWREWKIAVSWTWGMGEVCNMLLDQIMGLRYPPQNSIRQLSSRLGANISNGA